MKTVGVLALQGGFEVHARVLRRLKVDGGLSVTEVKTPEHLSQCDGLVIPGGESTAIKVAAESINLVEPLRDFCRHKPVWGTCAGCILVSDRVSRSAGEAPEPGFLGGVDCTTTRNYFGSQANSFEVQMLGTGDWSDLLVDGLFVRAPAIVAVGGPHVDVLASVTDGNGKEVIAAVRHGLTLATVFHPEFTDNDVVARYFVERMVLADQLSDDAAHKRSSVRDARRDN